MRKWISMLISAALLTIGTLQPCAYTVAAELDFSELEKVALEELKETNTPGAAIAIISGDRIIFVKGFGVELALTKVGDQRFAFQFSNAPPEELIIKSGTHGRPAYLHHYVWAFKRRDESAGLTIEKQ